MIIRSTRAALAAALILAVVPAAAAARTDGSTPMSIGVYDALTSVSQATFNTVGAKHVSDPAQFDVEKLSGKPLTRNGKPVFLTGNLAWCPHCAANSWAIALALLHFGEFTRLRTIDTGTYYGSHGGPKATDHTKGISFFNAGYNSDYVVLQSVVYNDLRARKLQPFSPAQKQAVKFAGGSFPVTNIGGLYGTVGSGYDPIYLKGAGLSHQQIANLLNRPTSAIAKRVDGLANFFTAAICRATNGQPADVCGTPGVKAGAKKLPS